MGLLDWEFSKDIFDENNFTHGTELKMYQPGIYSCTALSPAKGYKFEPKSETSTPRCSPFEYCAWIEQMQDHVFFYGYWEDTKFHKFESGKYTIIAGDSLYNAASSNVVKYISQRHDTKVFQNVSA